MFFGEEEYELVTEPPPGRPSEAGAFIVSEWYRQPLYHTKYGFLDLNEITEEPKKCPFKNPLSRAIDPGNGEPPLPSLM